MADLPRVSILIVSWNALPLLQRFLPSVAATDYPDLEIVLGDNASSDGTAEWVRATIPGVRIVRHVQNRLFAGGNNAAWPVTTGKYVVLLNNDVEVPQGWLHPLVRCLEENPDVAAVQPKLHQVDRPNRFEYAGASGGFLDRFAYPFTRGRLFSTLEDDRGQYDDAQDVFWATGAALMLRRAAIDEIGLFDEHFEMHMEEIDLCWRLWRAGWRVRVEPASVVRHLGGGSLPKGDPQKVFYNFRNSFLLLHKHLPRPLLKRIEPLRYALDTAAGAQAIAGGRIDDLRAIVRAHSDYRRLKRIIEPVTDLPVVLPPYRGSIAVDYFVRGRKRFSDLPSEAFEATAALANADSG
jgi:GT2 family glycosyltransferase